MARLPGSMTVLLAAAAVRAAYLLAWLGSPFAGTYRNDQLYYREWALKIAAGDWIRGGGFEQAPLYAYLLGLLYRILGPRDPGVLIVQLLCGVATVALVRWCARCLWGERAGLIAGLLAALYGPFVFYECMVMKTFLEPLLVMATLAAGCRGAAEGRWRWFAAGGAALGLACLVREVHAILLVPLLAAAWTSTGRGLRLHRAGLSALVLLAFSAALLPSALHNRAAAGESALVSSSGGQNFYLAFGPYATGYYAPPPFLRSLAYQEHEDFREEALLRTGWRMSRSEYSRYWFLETLRSLRDEPLRAPRLVIRKAVALLNDYEAPDNEDYAVATRHLPLLRLLPTFGWVAGLGAVGLFAAIGRGRAALLPAGFAVGLALEILLTFDLGRYRAAFAAVWLVFAGGGLEWFLSGGLGTARGGLARRTTLVAGTAMLTALAFLPPPGKDARQLAGVHDRFAEEALQLSVARDKVRELQGRLAERPGDPGLHYELGVALAIVGRIGEAQRSYEESLQADPAGEPPRLRLAELLLKVGEPRRAAVHARAGVVRNPDSAAGWLLLGNTLLRLAEHSATDQSYLRLTAEARECYTRVLGLDRNSVEGRYGLGKLLYLAGDGEGALRELGHARKLAAAQSLDAEHGRAAHLIDLVRRSATRHAGD